MSLPPAARLRSAVPALPVADVDATAAWYAAELGFRTAGIFPPRPPSVWASLQRDRAEIMLQRVEGVAAPGTHLALPRAPWHIYFRMDGVQALYDTIRDKPYVTMPLRRQPYGDWEFELQDLNGYVLVFGGDETIPHRGEAPRRGEEGRA